jgi:hypothetical protein
MEFYFELLHACTVPKNNVLGIYARAKFLLAWKVFPCLIVGSTIMVSS